MNKKSRVLYCDDNSKWIKMFKERHSAEFEIETINKCRDFETKLQQLKSDGKMPDVILIDLFHPKDGCGQDKRDIAGKKAVIELKNAIKIAKDRIYEAWDANGFKMLKQARAICPDTPIAIYTDQGLAIADNDDLKMVSEMKGEWLLKREEGDEFYEAYRLRTMLAAKHYTDVTRKALWIFATIIFIVALMYSWIAEHNFYNVLSLSATLVSILLALMPEIISHIERRTRGK